MRKKSKRVAASFVCLSALCCLQAQTVPSTVNDDLPLPVKVGAGSYATRPPRCQAARPGVPGLAGWGEVYRVENSNDGSKWVKIYETDSGKGGIEEINPAGAKGRYVRINCLKRKTGYGNSIYDVEVYGSVAGKN